jgi:hypothetical protein
MQTQTQQTVRNAFTGFVFLSEVQPVAGSKRTAATGGEITYTKTGLIHRAKNQQAEREEEDFE